MSQIVRGATDDCLDALLAVLDHYESLHPHAKVEAYRLDSASIRVRIIDPDFRGMSRSDRHERLWESLDQLPEEVLSHLSTLLLLTPEEQKTSFASMEFDDPAATQP